MKYTAPYKLLLLAIMALTVSGCGILPPPGPKCVAATDFGEVTTAIVDVDSKSSAWVNTNVTISERSQVQIEVEPGSLLLCGKEENVAVNVNAKNSAWTPTNIFVHKDDQLIISINSRNSDSNVSGPAAGHYLRYGGSDHEEGDGLNVKVGGGISKDNCHNDDCNDGGIILPDGGTALPEKGMKGYSGVPFDTSLITGTPIWTSTGQGLPLYLRTWDKGDDLSENDGYNDNFGGYVATITHYGCPRYNGENLRLFIRTQAPPANLAVTDTLDLGPQSTSFKEPTKSSEKGKLWLKIYDLPSYNDASNINPYYERAPGDGYYPNNDGTYKVKITVLTLPPDIISDAIDGLVRHIKSQLNTAQQVVYGNIVHGTMITRIVKSLLALYIIIYGIMFIYGMIEQTQMDFLIRVVKIGIIIQLLSATSYHFFNTYIFSLFTDGSSYLIHAMANAYSGTPTAGLEPGQDIKWTFLDQTFSQIFSQSTWIKLAGLLFAFPLGWIFLILIILAMAQYIIAVAWIILTYLLSLVAISLLISVAPIFIIFLLFTKTADMFKRWLNLLFNYALLPVILVALLTIFNYFVVAALLRVLNFGVCWKCIWEVNIGFPLCLWNFYSPLGWFWKDPINTLPVTVIDILILFMFVRMLPKLITYAERTSRVLTSATGGVGLTGIAKTVGNNAEQKLKSTVGLDDKSRTRRKNAAASRKLQMRAQTELNAEKTAKGLNPNKGKK